MSDFRRSLAHRLALTGVVGGVLLGACGPAIAQEAPSANLPVIQAQEDPAMVQAAKRDDLPGVKALLGRKTDLNARGTDETVALHWAAANHNPAMVEALLKAGADPNLVNDYKVSPLLIAARAGDAAIIRLLVAAGADPNTPQWSGQTPLMHAARSGNVDAVSALLDGKADPNLREQWGQTAMMWAAAAGHTEVVKRLIAGGADLKAATPQVTVEYLPGGGFSGGVEQRLGDTVEDPQGGWAPIHFAAREGHKETVEALVAAGEDVNRATVDGTTPLLAALYRHVQVDIKPPYDSEVIGDLPTAEWLLKNGAKVNAATRDGLTPLHAAVFIAAGKDRWSYALDEDPAVTPHDELGEAAVSLLLAHGADPNLKTKEYLIRVTGGANRHHAAYKDISPFLLAGTLYKDKVQQLMLASGRVDAKARDADGRTLLMQAAMLNSVGTAKLLIEAGADVNAVDNEGRTALHFAAMQPLTGAVHAGYPDTHGPRGGGDMAETLLAAGAKFAVKDKDGRTPLDIANMEWPAKGMATGHVVKNAPRVAGFFFEENQPGRNFSRPAKRLSAKVVLERVTKGGRSTVASAPRQVVRTP